MWEEKYSKWLDSKNVLEQHKNILRNMTKQEIKRNFSENLTFGTAGIRRLMKLGSSFLNVYTIKMIAYAWVKTLENHYPHTLKKQLIVAHDSRNNGVLFSEIVAQVISGMGYQAIMFYKNSISPTPIVSFAIRDKGFGGGACITASHNPPLFNGFKCFTEFGQHIMPEYSNLIAKELWKVDINTQIPMSTKNISFLPKDFEDHYLKSIQNILKIDQGLKKNLKIVFSPQHGASYKLGPKMLKDLGFDVYEVKSQSTPDGDFPNTPDPNPENPKAFDKMIKLGKKINAELLLTTDPDSDRIAVGSLHDSSYYLFNGHEMASLIVYYFLNKNMKLGKLNKNSYIIKTVVTTSLINRIANKFNVKVKNTLTGYKYIGEIIRTNDIPPILTTEESYGSSLCPNLSLDKDAIQLLPAVAELATEYGHKGKTLVNVLHEIYNQFGWFIHKNEKSELKGENAYRNLNILIEKMSHLKKIGGYKISRIDDYRNGIENFEKTNLVILNFVNESWIAIRPSGTEPLIRKYYCIIGDNQKDSKTMYNEISKEFKEIEKGIV